MNTTLENILFWQVIFATLSVSDSVRYKCDLIPMGIGHEAVENLSSKMALGLKKVTQKFARCWKESPEGSKSAKLRELKLRLAKLQKSKSEESLKDTPSPDLVQQIAKAQPPKVDWASLATKFAAFKQKKVPDQPDRPVATPARASYKLPQHVLDSLKAADQKPVAPFPTTADQEDDAAGKGDSEEADGGPKQKKGPGKKTTGAKKKEKKKGKKAQKAEPVGEEEEKALAISAPPQAVEKERPGVEYVAGEFNKLRLEYIKRVRKEQKISFRDASDLWMASAERAELLAGVSVSEMKKRRFM